MKRSLLLVVSIFSLLLVGFGCKGLTEEQQAAIQPVTLQYWTVFGDTETLNTLAAEYKKIRPYVTINIRQVRYEEFDKLFVNALADDVAPDLVSVHARAVHKYAARLSAMPSAVRVSSITVKGQYAPETIVTTENNVMPNLTAIQRNYVGTVANDVVLDGKIYGLPLSLDALALYYNKDILDRSGVAVPPSTWGELNEAVKKTTKFDSNGRIIQAGIAMGTANTIDNSADLLALLMMQNGVTMLQNGRVTFADSLTEAGEAHPSLEALRFYTDFARPTRDVYSWSDTMGNALEAFARGRVAFYIGYAFDRPRLMARGPQLPYEILPMPQLNAPVNVANYWVETVTKKTKHPNEAWDFIRFLSQEENIKTYTDAARMPSPLRIHVTEQVKDVNLAPFASQVLTAKNWYRGNDPDAAASALKQIIRESLLPVPENTDQTSRDGQAIIFAAQTVQQTL